MRADLFDQWHKQGVDPEVVARAANRTSTDVAWEKGLIAGFLMLTLCHRLGCEVNDEGQFRLAQVTQLRRFLGNFREGILTGGCVEGVYLCKSRCSEDLPA